MFHSGVSLDEVCGGLIDSDPALKCHSRSAVLVRIVPVTDRLALLFCALCKRFASIYNRQFINIFLCGPREQEGERGRAGVYWTRASLLTKQFQQVETCFWICSSPGPSPPSPPLPFVAHLWRSRCSFSRCASFPFQRD